MDEINVPAWQTMPCAKPQTLPRNHFDGYIFRCNVDTNNKLFMTRSHWHDTHTNDTTGLIDILHRRGLYVRLRRA